MKTGRPRVREITLMDGFYIEISNKGESKGLKIRSESKAAMEISAKQYAKFKDVTDRAAGAGIVLTRVSDQTVRTIESHVAKYFDVSLGVIQRRTKQDDLWNFG